MNKVLLTKQTVGPTLSLWDVIVSREGSSWTWVVRPFSLILMAASSSAPLLGTRVVNSSAPPPMLPDTCLGRSSSPSTVNVRWMEGNLKCSVLCKTHLMFFLIALCISGLPFSSQWISNLYSICLVLLRVVNHRLLEISPLWCHNETSMWLPCFCILPDLQKVKERGLNVSWRFIEHLDSSFSKLLPLFPEWKIKTLKIMT